MTWDRAQDPHGPGPGPQTLAVPEQGPTPSKSPKRGVMLPAKPPGSGQDTSAPGAEEVVRGQAEATGWAGSRLELLGERQRLHGTPQERAAPCLQKTRTLCTGVGKTDYPGVAPN